MRAVVLAAFICLLAACGKAEQGYPAEYERNFMQACEAQGSARTICACIWAKVETDVPRREFEALERAPGPERASHPLQRQIEGYALECATAPQAP